MSGDFNYTSIDWTAIQLATGNSETAEFLDFCLNHNLTQLINEPTRVAQDSANTLDLVLTTHTEYSSFITYLPELSERESYSCYIFLQTVLAPVAH